MKGIIKKFSGEFIVFCKAKDIPLALEYISRKLKERCKVCKAILNDDDFFYETESHSGPNIGFGSSYEERLRAGHTCSNCGKTEYYN